MMEIRFNLFTVVLGFVICVGMLACGDQSDPESKEKAVRGEGIEDSTQKIAASLVIKKSHRDERSIEEVVDLLDQMQLTVTGRGAATISIRANRAVLEEVFQINLKHWDREKNIVNTKSLAVPDILIPYIVSISLEEKHQYFDE